MFSWKRFEQFNAALMRDIALAINKRSLPRLVKTNVGKRCEREPWSSGHGRRLHVKELVGSNSSIGDIFNICCKYCLFEKTEN